MKSGVGTIYKGGQRATPRGADASQAGRRWGLAVVAAMLAVVTMLAVFQLTGPSVPGARLWLPDGSEFAIHPMPFSGPPTTVRGEPEPEALWKEAETAYASRHFRRAAEFLSRIGEDQPHAADAALYRGISLLLAGRIKEARVSLAQARRLTERYDLPQGSVLWFSGLAALADGDPAAARISLAAARDAGGTYAVAAGDLLRRLETD